MCCKIEEMYNPEGTSGKEEQAFHLFTYNY